MTNEEVFKVIAKALDVKDDEINIDTKASDLIEWDSLGHLSILMELEVAFGQSRNDERLASAISVKDILSILKRD